MLSWALHLSEKCFTGGWCDGAGCFHDSSTAPPVPSWCKHQGNFPPIGSILCSVFATFTSTCPPHLEHAQVWAWNGNCDILILVPWLNLRLRRQQKTSTLWLVPCIFVWVGDALHFVRNVLALFILMRERSIWY